MKGNNAREIIKVINNYKDGLNLLDEYDHRIVSKPKGTTSKDMIKYEDYINIISKLKFNNDSSLFALEKNKGLQSIIDNNTLVAVTLLIAESNPKEKDILVNLVMKFLI